ncbi:SdrD B-like domain-containing protein, partial [Staphylococcus auricularis]|uniref:SdrD B-like domain-containing protein n=1 Tax=Staphylococcus auricularis TaxID=29379 RepID=UPI003F79FD8F
TSETNTEDATSKASEDNTTSETNTEGATSGTNTKRIVNYVNELSNQNLSNNLINVTSNTIEPAATNTNGNIIDPFRYDRFINKITFNIDDAAKSGDSFTYVYGDKTTADDLSIKTFKPMPIVSKDGQIIANASYDQSTKTTTYTLTDYADNYKNIEGTLNIPVYIDRYEVPNDASNVTVDTTFAGNKETTEAAVDYSYQPNVRGAANIFGMMEEINPENKTTTEVVYVNPLGEKGSSKSQIYIDGSVTENVAPVGGERPVYGTEGSNQVDSSNNLEVYLVPSGEDLPESVKIEDLSRYTKIDIQPKYGKNGFIDRAQFNLDTSQGQRYIVKITSPYTDKDNIWYTAGMVSGFSKAAVVNGSKEASGSAEGQGDNDNSNTGEGDKVTEKYKLGDYVWEDTNKNGIQDTDEKGIAGVTVTLTKPDGSVQTTVTDEEGNYQFTDLPNGDYTVTFDTPEGYEPTRTNVGDDALDSDGQSVKVTIDNADNNTIDSGFVKTTPEPTPEEAKYTLGDKVWEDTNKDGIQNTNDPGIAGVTVTLTKPDGSVETTVTDEEGNYQFTDLPNGDYTVTFD